MQARRLFAVAWVALVAIACGKGKERVEDAAAYERAACACAMADIACAKATKDTYDARVAGNIDKATSTEERAALEQHSEAARTCLEHAWSCRGPERAQCPEGYSCTDVPNPHGQRALHQCRPASHEGEACGGERPCAPGLVCKGHDPADVVRECDGGPCIGDAPGVCGKPAHFEVEVSGITNPSHVPGAEDTMTALDELAEGCWADLVILTNIYGRTQDMDASMEDSVALTVVVGAGGAVTSAHAASEGYTAACIERAAKNARWSAPPDGRPATVRATFTFKSWN